LLDGLRRSVELGDVPGCCLFVEPIPGEFFDDEQRASCAILAIATTRSGTWCSERLATTASNGSDGTNCSSVTRSKIGPSGATGSIAVTL